MEIINYLNPVDAGFQKVADDFHGLKNWQKVASVVAAVVGAILTPFILGFGAIAAFRFSVERFTLQNGSLSDAGKGEDHPLLKGENLQGFPPLKPLEERTDSLSKEILSGGSKPSAEVDEAGKGDPLQPATPLEANVSGDLGNARAKALIETFDSLWDPRKKDFKNIPFDIEEVSSLLQGHNRAFNSLTTDQEENFGVIYKQDLPKGAKIYVRADLHGDLKSLLENLKELQKEGLLDENFKCKDDVQLVFLGDYMDRGEYAIEIAQVLASLRFENPGKVHLLRGNHEDLSVNFMYGRSDEHLRRFLDDGEKSKILSAFYETMPLSVYLGEEGAEGREYVQFSHALFELKVDPSIVLDSEEPFSSAAIPRELEMSERVRKIAYEKCDYGKLILSARDKVERKRLKIEQAAERVNALAIAEESGNRSDGEGGVLTAYQWADVGDQTHIYSLGRRRWALSPADIKHSFRLASEKHRVKMLFRGHQHYFKHHCDLRNRVIVSTLPVGMDSPYKKNWPDQKDRAYILEVKPKVKNWTKRAITRASGESQSEISEAVGIREAAV